MAWAIQLARNTTTAERSTGNHNDGIGTIVTLLPGWCVGGRRQSRTAREKKQRRGRARHPGT
jgi:hypothetical protein